jgi:hypothetical protein
MATQTTPTTAELLAAAKAAEQREHLARWALPSGSGPIGYADQACHAAHDAAKARTAAAWAALKERPDWEVVWSRRYAPENVAAAEARMRAGSEAQ